VSSDSSKTASVTTSETKRKAAKSGEEEEDDENEDGNENEADDEEAPENMDQIEKSATELPSSPPRPQVTTSTALPASRSSMYQSETDSKKTFDVNNRTFYLLYFSKKKNNFIIRI
jgi:hypothetical protein